MSGTQYYVRDVAGTAMAIYGTTVEEHTVYGATRLGVYKRGANKTTYELTDHLGNVRALVEKGSAQPKGATDYYPGGMAMPNRNLKGDYRYAYQGQEVDPETGKPAFELRLYDPRISRWMAPDPYGQYNSPYLAMGNNGVNMVDPDGGMACPDPPCNGGIVDGGSLGEVIINAPGRGGRTGGFDFSQMPNWINNLEATTWDTSFIGDLNAYNQEYNTNYTEGQQYNQYYYQHFYKPELDDLIGSIHQATGEAAELIMDGVLMVAPIGEIAVGSRLIYMGVTRVSKVSIHGYRAMKVGHASSKALKSSVYFTKNLSKYGLNKKFFAPTLYGSSKTLRTFLGRNSPVLGAGLVLDGSRRLYNNFTK